MFANLWIFLAFSLVPTVRSSEADEVAFAKATSKWQESSRQLFGALEDIGSVVTRIFLHPNNETSNAGVENGTFCTGSHFRLAAESLENLTQQCSPTSDICRADKSLNDFAPGVLRAAAQLCDNAQAAEYIKHIRTLAPCWPLLSHRRMEFFQTRFTGERKLFELLEAELNSAKDNSTVSCGIVNGRKYACRMIQTAVPLYTALPGAFIREVCGQKEHDLVQMLEERAANVLNCSEFGDYAKDFTLFRVDYKANQAQGYAHQFSF